MRALACNRTAQESEQQQETTTKQSSANRTVASRRGSSDSQNSTNDVGKRKLSSIAITDKMRKRLGEIEDSLPPPLRDRVGLKLSDAIDWQEDAPLPSVCGYLLHQSLWVARNHKSFGAPKRPNSSAILTQGR